MGSPWTIPTEMSNGGGPCTLPVPIYKSERLEIDYPYPYYPSEHEDSMILRAEVAVGVPNRRVPKRPFFRLGILTPEPVKRLKESSAYAVSLREIPSWDIYYRDQRKRLVNFTDTGNPLRPDCYLNKCVSLCFDDVCITKLDVDAVVTSTHNDYAGACGVDQRIHEVGGRGLKDACKNLPRCDIGNAEITHGFMLPAKYIIHTNGPCNDNPERLKSCYESSLNLLLQYNLRTIAFPCISTGEKSFTRKIAAATALATVRSFLERHRNKVDRIIFCLHNSKDIEIYRRFMQIYFPVADY